jgi:hypothetical protein
MMIMMMEMPHHHSLHLHHHRASLLLHLLRSLRKANTKMKTTVKP